IATGGRLGSLPARRAKMLPTGSTSTAQPSSRTQATKRSRISLSSGDTARRRKPVSRKRPIWADRPMVAHNRSASTLRLLSGFMRLSMTVSSRLGDTALAQVWAAEVELAISNSRATRDAPGRQCRFGRHVHAARLLHMAAARSEAASRRQRTQIRWRTGYGLKPPAERRAQDG